MCGFAGIVAWDGRFRVDRETLGWMSARIAHRGPDGQGMLMEAGGADGAARRDGQPQVGLAHRRLAILDPEPRADQPFTDGAGRWVVFNGEIYNFRALRAELSGLRPEYAWRTQGDTEVLLIAYDVWGEACCDRLDGMFAFAVWDPSAGPAGRLLLARDRMGQKPLYFALAPAGGPGGEGPGEIGAVAFASELPALLAVPWVGRTVDPAAVADYLRLGYVPEGSIYREIGSVAPSTTVWIGGGCGRGSEESCRRSAVRRYFQANAVGPAALGGAEGGEFRGAPAEVARRLVLAAVQRQLVSDVPLGCSLSGGIDSSIVAGAMRAAVPRGEPVMTFTIGFDDPRYDESPYAAAVARHLGTEHHHFQVKPDAAEDLPKLAAVFGEPFGDSSALPTHYLARETRRVVKVALSGDGGDELFGGYDRYRAMLLGRRIDALPAVRSLLEMPVWQKLPGAHPKGHLARLKRFLAPLGEEPARRYARYVALFDERGLSELLEEGFAAKALGADGGGDRVDLLRQFEMARAGEPGLGLPARDEVQAALALDRVTYLPGDLLTKVDRCSMLHALEVRSPFMDPAVVRFAAGLSTEQLLRGGPKRLLREAFCRDLPAIVFKRRKMGFAVPVGEWFRTDGKLRRLLRDALLSSGSFASAHFRRERVRRMIENHEDRIEDHSQRLYALLMLELWWKNELLR